MVYAAAAVAAGRTDPPTPSGPSVVFAATTLGNPFTTSITAAVPIATLAAAVIPTAPILTATVTVAAP